LFQLNALRGCLQERRRIFRADLAASDKFERPAQPFVRYAPRACLLCDSDDVVRTDCVRAAMGCVDVLPALLDKRCQRAQVIAVFGRASPLGCGGGCMG
jgi:hypothetical protein